MPQDPPKSFKNLGKEAQDLLNKGFPSTEKFDWKAEVTTSTADNGKLSASLTKNPSSENNAGDIVYKYPTKFGDFTTKLDLGNAIKFDYMKKNLFFKGFDANSELTVNQPQKGDPSDSTIKFGGDYQREWLNSAFQINNLFRNNMSFKGSAVVGTPTIALGLETDVTNNTDSNNPIALKSTLSYSPGSNIVQTLSWRNKDNQVAVTYYKKSSKKPLAVAAELAVSPNDTSIALGASYLRGDSSVKARLNNQGSLGVAFTRKLNSSTSVTGMTELNVSSQSAAGPRLGLIVSLTY